MGVSNRGTDAATAAAVFLAVAVAFAGATGWYRGTVPTGIAVGAAMLAAGVLAAQRTMWVHTAPTEAGALSNAGLFVLAAAAKVAGVELAVPGLETAAEALFLIAVAYFLLRAYG
ncbi:hypothetical protein Hbl1158_05935 [Halobaculum sp. CBA1158]|uniref:hypothetical protein n=1 Tax=Halobaculum sp. CBA1158 TaxID=2904243 RepID=UPI001F16CD9E|nr:hypothetical protein [Halobaculum sp. CBA1158]UIP00896.1 hypothetical protein Hbl1158_05935 [Halobaculum sp. CBA1158]